MADAPSSNRLLPKGFGPIVDIDFESVPDGNIFQMGAVFQGRSFSRKDIRDIPSALAQLNRFASGARYILGHNIAVHDLPLARQAVQDMPGQALEVLDLPVIDTLYLSPLAFPENPYHRLVKDYKLAREGKNDPVADARLARLVFEDQVAAFDALGTRVPELIGFFAFAFALSGDSRLNLTGIFDLFHTLAGQVPDRDGARSIFKSLCREKICASALDTAWDELAEDPDRRPVLAYLLSWLRVAGGSSVIPPWVRHRFPEIRTLVSRFRYACGHGECDYCRKVNDPERLLHRYFGFDRYRNLPDGRPLQKEIIQAGLEGHSLLGILPTGGGKSICYQIPALHRYHRTGALTIVISPLKALMKDQVDNLNRATGSAVAGAVNGSLTLPERGDVMERVRLGDIGILYISPEQLRNYSVADLIASREVGCWVFDEAHCLSKWGHDFRPDYLYVSQFIKEQSQTSGIPPLVGAFTATAKADVVEEICCHFKAVLDLELVKLMGGVQRDNLNFQVWPVTRNEKYDVVLSCLKESFDQGGTGAIVYCASRRGTEHLNEFLNEKGVPAQAFHAGRSEPDKRNIQDGFVAGQIPVICATNAFGMGIDKKDIRLVVHADIPGSLDNYLQEAGRAGRDMAPSDCILLYEQEDIENQFALNAQSRLSLKDIKKILALLKKRAAHTPQIVITPGEIMRLMGCTDFSREDARAKIGVSWLERKGFVSRSFNQTLVFKGRPTVRDMAEAEERLARLNLSRMMHRIYRRVLTILFNADKDGVLSADEICAGLGSIENLPQQYMETKAVMGLLSSMAGAGLIKEGAVMTAFVRPRGRGNSRGLLDQFMALENGLLALMEELSPEAFLDPDTPDLMNLRLVSQQLKERGFEDINAHVVEMLLRSLAKDRGAGGTAGGGASLKIAGRKGTELQRVYVKYSWQEIRQRAALRHQCARVCLDAMVSALPQTLQKGQSQVMAEFFFSDLVKAMGGDLFLSEYPGDARALAERSLLFMHDMKVITLQNGLGVFRQALTLTLLPEGLKRQYTRGDYEPLDHHYAQKNVQVHVMEKFARLGLDKIKTALAFVSDYFSSSYEEFVKQHFPRQKTLIQTAMTGEAYSRIIQGLGNPVQEAIVAAPPDRNLLVLAGPGSGKTRTIVHRCAWLIRAKSVDPAAILVLCFNHQAMVELRKRIRALVGRRAGQVTAMTYHGFAMRLAGRSLLDAGSRGRAGGAGAPDFDAVIDEAVDILTGRRQMAGLEQGEARGYLLAQYRHILVDEYQDIDHRQYRFISAVTGRLEQDADTRISIMAVGDDDQSIYGFRDANVEFIKQFQADYDAKVHYLVENYRSSHPIVQAANAFISRNEQRMKTGWPCRINTRRQASALAPEKTDPQDLVRIVSVEDLEAQALFVAREIQMLKDEHPDLDYDDIAVVARQGISFPPLVACRMALAGREIPFCHAVKSDAGFPIHRTREVLALVQYLEARGKESLRPLELKAEILGRLAGSTPWTQLVSRLLDVWCAINSDRLISLDRARAFVLETLFEETRAHKTGTGVFLGTAHSVKGMEFDHVFILDGGWPSRIQDPKAMEEERRLFYVAMTRARTGLWACHTTGSPSPHVPELAANDYVLVTGAGPASLPGYHPELTVSVLGMADIYLSWAARFPHAHGVHGSLARLNAMDRVHLVQHGGQIYVKSLEGMAVARLSAKGCRRWEHRLPSIVSARVMGMVTRLATDGQGGELRDEKKRGEKVEKWEVPVVEILHRR